MTLYEQLHTDNPKIQATISTSAGEIELILFPDHAPKAVENFVTHAKNGYYEGIVFHRVIPNFMIQTGDPTGTGRGGESIWGQNFEDEFSEDLRHFKGALSMANAGAHTNGSQFFIVTASEVPSHLLKQMASLGYPDELIEAYQENGGTPWLDGKHSVFGQVARGMEVAEAIQNADRDIADKPLEDIVIEKIVINESF